MFWRSATIGGLVWFALSLAVCSNGEDTTADANNSKERATEERVVGDKETIEIPLSEIWALEMPGTRDVRELEPEALKVKDKTLPLEERFKLLKKTLTWQISQSLPPSSKKAGPGFVVSRPRPELLEAVRDVLMGETKRTDSFPAGSDITAVFFSSSGLIIHIYHVERRANVVEIQYRFVPHEEDYMSEHFALIPLGKLPSGLYQVKVVLGPLEQKFVDAGFEQNPSAAKNVSRSFKFEVQQ